MAGRVHPEPEAQGEGEQGEGATTEPVKEGKEPRVVIVNHGDAREGKHPTLRIRTGHSSPHPPFKTYEVCRNALGCISYDFGPRKLALAIIEWKWFDRFIFANIAVISLLSASYQARAPDDEGFNAVATILEQVINGFFTAELVLKVFGWGLICHKGAYLRNPWNILDFLVVLDANMQYIPNFSGGGFNFLRLFRALRPLRSLKQIPQMKVLVNTLLCSIPRLGNVTLMGAFLFLIFAVIGITLMDGIFYHRCRETQNPVLDTALQCWQWTYSPDDRLCGGRHSCPEGSFCAGHEEDPNESLRPVFPGGRQGFPWCTGSEPAKLYPETDFIHFDHLGGAILIVFQCMTLEGWTDIMYWVQDGYNELVATFFFCIMICVTSHFLLNVALAVVDEVRDNFDGEEEEENAGDENAEEEDGEEDLKPIKLWLNCSPVRFLHGIAHSEIFLNLILMAIVGNVITMCLEKYPEETSWKDFISVAEITFLVIFCLEMVIMVGAMGPVAYAKNPVTAFDGVIVIVSVIQQALGQSGPLTALRTLRLFRVLNKLQDRWHSLRVLLKAMLYTGMALNYWLVLFVLVLYICTLMAQSFFQKKFHFNDPDAFDAITNQDQAWCTGIESLPQGQRDWHYWQDCIPRAHFDHFLWAFVTIFQIMTGENWNTVMYAGMRATSWPFVIFFWFLIIFGQILFVSLFLSILTSKFQLVNKQIAEEQEKERQKEERLKEQARLEQARLEAARLEAAKKDGSLKPARGSNLMRALQRGMSRTNSVGALLGDVGKVRTGSRLGTAQSTAEEEATNRVLVKPLTGTDSQSLMKPLTGTDSHGLAKPVIGTDSQSLPGQIDDVGKIKGEAVALQAGENKAQPGESQNDADQPPATPEKVPTVQEDSKETAEDGDKAATEGPKSRIKCCKCCGNWPYGYAFFFLHRENIVRRAARWLLNMQVTIKEEKVKVFDNVILLCILLSTVCMMVDYPLRDPEDIGTKIIRTADTVFAIIFIAEMVVKLTALGLIWGPDTYLRSPWNWLDGMVVLVSIMTMSGSGKGGFLKTLRILRALRPLRVISRNENLKVVVQTIFASVPDLAMLLVVISLFLLIFALVCLSYLKGQFFHCPMDGDGPHPALIRDIPNFRTPLCLADALPNGTSPLGYSNDVLAAQDGSWNLSTNAWDIGSCGAGSHAWARATIDTPICIGRCDPYESTSIQPPSWLCAPKFTTMEELPPVGSCVGTRPLTAAEERGAAFVSSMQRALVLPCGGSTVVNGALDLNAGSAASCRALFCPADTIPDDRKQSCRSNCRKHTDFCLDACDGQDVHGDSLTPNCASCLNECQAQCECSEFCEPLIKDAALCHEQGQTWSPQLSQSFDNIWTSLLTLFEISTTEGWVDVMYSAADSNGLYMQPLRDNQQWIWAPFFVFFIFFMTMFLINLSVGIIVERFIELKNTKGGRPMMTAAQEQWVRSKLFLYGKKYFHMTNLHHLPRVRRVVYDFVSHKYFDRAIMGAICFNTLLMSLKIFPAPADWYPTLLQSLNYFFFGVFLLEAILKLFAMRLTYFKDNWNTFDFVCVMMGVISLAVRIFSSVDVVAVSGVVRIFRIARLFRLIRKFKEINKIFLALVLSLPKLANVMGVLLLVLTLYSILGVSLFSVAKKPPDGTLNVHGNFDDFWKAFITLFRASTGEAWNELMHDLAKDERTYFRSGEWCTPSDIFDPTNGYPTLQSKCLTEEPNACVIDFFGQNIMPVGYWCSYIVVCLHLMMNLVIAVILDGYEEGRHTPPEQLHIELCMEKWKGYDPDITEKIPLPRALAFVQEASSEILKEQGKKNKRFKSQSSAAGVQAIELDAMPMHLARHLDLQMTPDGQVSFSSATRQVLRIAVLYGTDDQSHEELDNVTFDMLQATDGRTANRLRSIENRTSVRIAHTGEGVDLRSMIAATKLQKRWRNHVRVRRGDPPAGDGGDGGDWQGNEEAGPPREREPLQHPPRAG